MFFEMFSVFCCFSVLSLWRLFGSRLPGTPQQAYWCCSSWQPDSPRCRPISSETTHATPPNQDVDSINSENSQPTTWRRVGNGWLTDRPSRSSKAGLSFAGGVQVYHTRTTPLQRRKSPFLRPSSHFSGPLSTPLGSQDGHSAPRVHPCWGFAQLD